MPGLVRYLPRGGGGYGYRAGRGRFGLAGALAAAAIPRITDYFARNAPEVNDVPMIEYPTVRPRYTIGPSGYVMPMASYDARAFELYARNGYRSRRRRVSRRRLYNRKFRFNNKKLY